MGNILSWDMTIGEYQTYFREHPEYRAFCQAYYHHSIDVNPKGTKDKTRPIAYQLHTIFSFLLTGTPEEKELLRTYYNDVMLSYAANDNDGARKEGIRAVFTGNKDYKEVSPSELLEVQTKGNERKNMSVSSAFDAWKAAIQTLHETHPPVNLPDKNIDQLKPFFDTLLTPPDKDSIQKRIQEGGCRQIILTGAPGTGKTYTAREIAKELGAKLKNEKTQKYEAYTLVQFHPSYDYTDFVEGLRPVGSIKNASQSSQIDFAKMDGTFKAFCRSVVKANQNHDSGVETSGQTAQEIQSKLETLQGLFRDEDVLRQFLRLSACFDVLDAGENNPASLHDAVSRLDPAALKKHAEAFSDGALQQAAKHLAVCAHRICSIPDNYTQALFEMAVLSSPGLLEAIGACIDKNNELDTASACAIYDASIELRNALSNLRSNKVDEAFGCRCFDAIFKCLRDKAIFPQTSATKEDTKKATVSTNAAEIRTMLQAVQTAYPISKDTREALTRLADESANIQRQIGEIADSLKSMRGLSGQDTAKAPLYFFIIDEINRANLSKVFGELMYCLEKDKRGTKYPPIQTQYHNLDTRDGSGAPIVNDVFARGFYIPENVVIIGTMNDIDRSVDSMDFALRRRFEWKEIVVNEQTLTSAFCSGEYGAVIREDAGHLARCIMALNRYMETAGEKYGLNRQYFISQGQFSDLPDDKKNLRQILEHVWVYRIEPLLRDYLWGEPESVIRAFQDGAHNELLKTVGKVEKYKKDKAASKAKKDAAGNEPSTPNTEADEA